MRGITFHREETRISGFENDQVVPDPLSGEGMLERSKNQWQIDFIRGKKMMLSRVLTPFD